MDISGKYTTVQVCTFFKRTLFKEIYTFIQQEYIKLIESLRPPNELYFLL